MKLFIGTQAVICIHIDVFLYEESVFKDDYLVRVSATSTRRIICVLYWSPLGRPGSSLLPTQSRSMHLAVDLLKQHCFRFVAYSMDACFDSPLI
jgi:hypothetical protein